MLCISDFYTISEKGREIEHFSSDQVYMEAMLHLTCYKLYQKALHIRVITKYSANYNTTDPSLYRGLMATPNHLQHVTLCMNTGSKGSQGQNLASQAMSR